MTAGISDEEHADAQCANAANADFEVVLRVAGFADGDYKLGIALLTKQKGRNVVTYYECDETFTVKDEAVAQAVDAFAIAAEQAAAIEEAAAEAEAGMDEDFISGEEFAGVETSDEDFADADVGGDAGTSTSVG